MRPTWGLIYWPVFLALVSIQFLPFEIFALITNSANTLSDYSWYELNISNSLHPVHGPPWILSLTAWLLFVAVITGHIWFRNPG